MMLLCILITDTACGAFAQPGETRHVKHGTLRLLAHKLKLSKLAVRLPDSMMYLTLAYYIAEKIVIAHLTYFR